MHKYLDAYNNASTSEGADMDVRLHRASKAAALTLMIILTTAIVSIWLNNLPPPISWEMDGNVSYIDAAFNIEIPASSNISYDIDVDDSQNTTRIQVEINTELVMIRGLLGFGMGSIYITPQSRYNITDSREVTLSASSSSMYWNATSFIARSPHGVSYDHLNESSEHYYEQNHTRSTTYSLHMVWNSSLTLAEEIDNNTTFDVHFNFMIHFNETQIQIDSALFDLIFFGEFIVGTVVIMGFYRIDRPDVIE